MGGGGGAEGERDLGEGGLKRQGGNSSICAIHWWPSLTSYRFLVYFFVHDR